MLLSSVPVQPGLRRTWSEIPKTGFLIKRLSCLLPADWQHEFPLKMLVLTFTDPSLLTVKSVFDGAYIV